MEIFNAETFLDLKCGLSEGPYWEQQDNVLRFVDIVNKIVYRVSLDQGPSSLTTQQYEHSVSVTAELEAADDSFIFGGKYGIGVAKKSGNETRLVQPFWTAEENEAGKSELMRANDGAVDSKGRFWASALCDPLVTSFAPTAVLFRLDPDGKFHRMITEVTIPNGLTWSKDNRTMYFTDTMQGTIFAYDFDEESGSISNKREFFHPVDGNPDGHTQDENGNLWVALWGGWKVVRVSPQCEVTAEIRVPTRCPTAVVFAGEDAYITSESEQEPEKYPESLKHAGSVFKCHVGVCGRPAFKARMRI